MGAFFAEAYDLFMLIARWLFSIVFLAALFLSVGFHEREIATIRVPVPYATSADSVAASFFRLASADLLPHGASLIASDPLDAFIVEFKFAFVASCAVLLPFFLLSLFSFLSPALSRRERRIIAILIAPAVILFFLGAWFSYRYVLPKIFSFLFIFIPAVGAEPLFSIGTFFSNTIALMAATGVAFELPVVMVLLSALGIIRARFWRVHWRGAVLTVLIATAIITPDGSGVSMLMLSAPLCGLYAAGAFVSSRVARGTSNDKQPTV